MMQGYGKPACNIAPIPRIYPYPATPTFCPDLHFQAESSMFTVSSQQ